MKLADLAIDLPFPRKQDEDWQFCDVSFLQDMDWVVSAPVNSPVNSDAPELRTSNKIQVVDGNLSAIPNFADGITCEVNCKVNAQEFQQTNHDWDYFAVLNLQHQPQIIHLNIADHCQVAMPLEINYLITQERSLVQPRLLLTVGKNSQLILVENFQSPTNNYLHNLVTEIRLSAGAKLIHIRCQQESFSAYHLATTLVIQKENSSYQGLMLDLGAHLSRHNPTIYAQAEGAVSQLWGLTITDGDRLADTHSCIHHSAPNSSSRQLHKAILSDRGQVVFNGRIFVSKLAQNTDSAQLSRTLLLSPQAKINTKPQLEIIADNVKCKHGATVSQLDPEEIFYLQSRGINPASATQLLIFSFAGEVIDSITDSALKQQLAQHIKNALPCVDTADQR